MIKLCKSIANNLNRKSSPTADGLDRLVLKVLERKYIIQQQIDFIVLNNILEQCKKYKKCLLDKNFNITKNIKKLFFLYLLITFNRASANVANRPKT